jgi:hypothetical protein
VARRRQAWFDGQPDLDPARLIFVDESAATTKMARLRGRAPRGERCRTAVPHGPWTTTTFVGALRLSGMTAPMVLDGPMKGPAFPGATHEISLALFRGHSRRVSGGIMPSDIDVVIACTEKWVLGRRTLQLIDEEVGFLI